MTATLRVVLALILGLVLGIVGALWDSAAFRAMAAVIEPIGTLWTNAVRMTVIPLVVALVITGVAKTADGRRIGRLGARALPIFLGLLLASGFFAWLVAPLALDRLPTDDIAMMSTSMADTLGVRRMPSLVDRITAMVPANPIQAAAEGAVLPLVVFSLIFGFALTRLDAARREPVLSVVQSVADAMLVVVGWVVAVAPIGIFALALNLGGSIGPSAVRLFGLYIATLSGVLLAFILLLYPFTMVLGKVSLRRFAAAAGPAQAIAFSARSSLAALPVMITGARDQLGATPAVTGFALPLAVSVFRLNVPIAWVVGALFLSKLYGVPLDAGQMAGLVVTATLISFSVPGIPSSSLFLFAPVLVDLGLPAAGVGLLIALDVVPDMFKTTLNVTSHLATAAVLNRYESSPPIPLSPFGERGSGG